MKTTRPDEDADGEGGQPSSPEVELARDWITLWQSELNALAADPEAVRAWRASVQLWANMANWVLSSLPTGWPDDRSARPSRPQPPPWSTPAAPASDARGDEVSRLQRHIAELEQRLADVERRFNGNPSVDPASRRNRNH